MSDVSLPANGGLALSAAAPIISRVLDIKLIREKPDFVRQRLATRNAGDDALAERFSRLTTPGVNYWPKSKR